MLKVVCLLFLLTAGLVLNQSRGDAAGAGLPSYRLPALCKPDRYNLRISPDLQSGTFEGSETIDIDVLVPTNEIVLNSRDLNVTRAIVEKAKSTAGASSLAKVLVDASAQRIRLRPQGILTPGKWLIRLDFKGKLSTTLDGLYRSKFKRPDGSTGYFASTQFEATDARKMFPCFDEPELKAKFEMTAVIDPALTAISNMPIKQELVAGGKKVIAFEETPRMSTYLLALIIGDFKATEAITVEGVPIRTWCIGRDTTLGIYARDMAGKILPYLNSYFGIPYAWKKLDLIAIPDFESGAMENAGAVTFRENLLLVDKDTSLERKQSLVSVTAHEMAHMWFGNLVTMKWWDDIWLNEAFASWMAVKAVAHVAPEWNFETHFGTERIAGMRTDAMRSTRAIHARVRDPLEARQMFDEITYEKGAAILRMLEIYLGRDTFQKAVQKYMEKHQFANATGIDLWSAMENVSGKPVKSMMDAWSNKPGYPLLSVSGSGKNLMFSQQRFFLDGSAGRPGEIWKVPLSVRKLGAKVESNAEPKPEQVALLDQRSQPVAINGENTFLNSGGYGFYRVRYPDHQMAQITAALPDKLTAMERLSLVADQLALSIAGKTPLNSYMSLLSALRREDNPVVWDTIAGQIHYLNIFVQPQSRAKFSEFVKWLVLPQAQSLGWTPKDGESDDAKLARIELLTLLGTLGKDQATIDKARQLFASYIKTPAAVPNDLMEAVTVIVAYNGGNTEYEQITRLWKQGKTPEVELRNLFALARFQKLDLLSRTMKLAVSDEVKIQDGPHLLGALLRNAAGKEAAWTFVRINWTRLQKRFSPDLMVRIAGSPDQFVNEQKLAEVKQFFAGRKVPGGDAAIARMLERLSINVRFNSASGKELNDWLRKFSPAGS